jgi:phosphatidylethanolamine-binding protein (PEBP) family uncharacterized protein
MVQRNAFALLAAGVFAGGTLAAQAPAFEASSPDIIPGKPIATKFIYNGFGCTGQNVSPAVMWKNAPAGTKSFALMVHDPDAPTGGPCPPAGDKPHRYDFTVYALKVAKLDLPPTATASLAGFTINSNLLGKATFTGTFGR